MNPEAEHAEEAEEEDHDEEKETGDEEEEDEEEEDLLFEQDTRPNYDQLEKQFAKVLMNRSFALYTGNYTQIHPRTQARARACEKVVHFMRAMQFENAVCDFRP